MRERPRPIDLPAGFVIRPYRHDDDLPLLVDLVRDAFSDHFGHIVQSFERDLERFRHWLEGSSYFETDRVMLAMDEASGVCCRQPTANDRTLPPAPVSAILTPLAYAKHIGGEAWLQRC